MKTITKVLLGTAAAIAAIALLKKGSAAATTQTLSPLDKMTKDAFDPTTQFGADIKNYHDQNGIYNEDAIVSSLNWHLNPANNSWIKPVYFAKAQWAPNEAVTY